ncbi:MAG: HAMP domain-containing histidine kinase, partial [Gorillibacterium sp.]|nr:HAMP domain-containing histidine kinase [Gorillibacterium sp.]
MDTKLKNDNWPDLKLWRYHAVKNFWVTRVPVDVRGVAFALAIWVVVNKMEKETMMSGGLIGNIYLSNLSVLGDVLLLVFLLLNLLGVIRLLSDPARLAMELRRGAVISLYRQSWQKLLRAGHPMKIAIVAGTMLLLGFMIGVGLGAGDAGAFFGSIIGLLLYFAFLIPLLRREARQWALIRRGAKEMAGGNLNIVLPEAGEGQLFQLAAELNRMKQGFQQAVDNQLKSEHMKSELVTNVSHDLKTPLTSLINYVDLLKRVEATPEERSHYIEVLDRQTQRLKTLIDDLFDAAKMASGTVELKLEIVDIVALLNQALAEYEAKIAASTLTFRVRTESPMLYITADGNKTWRIVENLIGNALKYTMPNTRVYLTLTEHEQNIQLVIQNVSEHELDFNVAEIFERFKRGDRSRATEGSGLGLAIARSIAELQGGSLNIAIDGDQFKAIVMFL